MFYCSWCLYLLFCPRLLMKFDKAKRYTFKALPLITIIFLVFVGIILYRYLSNIDWKLVWLALSSISSIHLVLTSMIVLINYLLLSNYDLIGVRFLKIKGLSLKKILPSAFISYVFNFNLGAMIGGMGFRYRIYSGWKVPKIKIALLIVFTVLTTWLGYFFLIAMMLTFKSEWANLVPDLNTQYAKIIGIVLFISIAIYLYNTTLDRTIKIRKSSFHLPTLKLSLLQILLSTVQWCLPTGVIYFFLKSLGADVEFESVLFTYLVGAVAGVIARVPAGIGTIEAIFFRMNFSTTENTLAAILCFRFIYYIIPLFIAILSYLALEYYQKRLNSSLS